jgi:hypothetical protein
LLLESGLAGPVARSHVPSQNLPLRRETVGDFVDGPENHVR